MDALKGAFRRGLKALTITIMSCALCGSLYYGRPNLFGYRVFYTLSGSMEPAIEPYQFVIGRVADPDDIREGDIAVYVKGEGLYRRLIIHRIIKKDGDTVVLKGDNNKESDPPESADRIRYKIVCY